MPQTLGFFWNFSVKQGLPVSGKIAKNLMILPHYQSVSYFRLTICDDSVLYVDSFRAA